ncbi:MAG TPA: hypothetical protein VEC14_07195, partial [Reyranellaceae bacterium]|nr:hypothetical protein [Reyranellaceae bacterium]
MHKAIAAATVLLSMAAMAVPHGLQAQDAEGTTRKWNVWADGRFYGIDDRVADQRSIGRNVSIGLDAKAIDWLTLGLGVSYETFDTRTGPQNLPTTSHGVGLNPYLVARLSPK